MRTLIILMALLAVPAFGYSATIYVDDDFDSSTPGWGVDHFDKIQDGINAASKSDLVLVYAGTYVENIDYYGKAITVKGNDGAGVTIIDGSNPTNPNRASCVNFDSGEDPDSVLDGFTLTNGTGTYDPVSGLKCGGGVNTFHAAPTIINNIVRGNTVPGHCAGIACGNNGSKMVVAYNVICENTGDDGGGIGCREASPTIMGNIIYNNTANTGGGITLYYNCAPTICNNIIYGNSANAGGGMRCFQNCNPQIINNTLYGNSAAKGGGILFTTGSSAEITNTILCKNKASDKGAEMWIGLGSTVSISYSDLKGGHTSVFESPGSNLVWDECSMIDQDPLCVDPAGGDYHLTWISPCINMGTNVGAPADDFDGEARPCMGTVDMGADEFTGIHPLEADALTVSQASGGVVNFALTAGVDNANRDYFLLGSVTGTCPGLPFPLGRTLPLNWDLFTSLVFKLANSPAMAGFNGTLDALGSGTAQLNTLGPLPPSAVGVTMYYAYLLYGPIDFSSNPLAVEIVP